jgi:hypothetical protein
MSSHVIESIHTNKLNKTFNYILRSHSLIYRYILNKRVGGKSLDLQRIPSIKERICGWVYVIYYINESYNSTDLLCVTVIAGHRKQQLNPILFEWTCSFAILTRKMKNKRINILDLYIPTPSC